MVPRLRTPAGAPFASRPVAGPVEPAPASRLSVAPGSGGEQSVLRGDAAGASPSPGRSGDMYARSTPVPDRPEALDDLAAFVRDDVMQMVTQLEVCIGLSLRTDRDTGRCIATSAWQTEDAMRDSAEQVPASRDRA